MKYAISILSVLMVLCGCENKEETRNSAVDVSGIYDVVELRQHIKDSYGTDDITEATVADGWMLGIQQSGSVVNFFDCFDNLMEDGRVNCAVFGQDYTNFGPMVKSVVGEMLFSDENSLSIYIYIQVYYTSVDFWGTNDLQVEAVLNQEYTDMLNEAFEEAF